MTSPPRALAAALGVTVLGAVALAVALDPARAARPSMLAIVGGAYGLLALATVLWLRNRGELAQRLAPAPGDVTKGFLVAAVLYGAAYGVSRLLVGPGSPREPWILRIYLHLGDPVTTSAWLVGLGVMGIYACEELVWRGGVLGVLTAAVGERRALWLSTLLYALSYAPTLWLLGDPLAGPNPLLVVAALVGGLTWGLGVRLFGRLMPLMVSHGLLAWALVAFPLWRP